ncbi:ribosome-binding factor A [Reichenbachiella sp. 5M10]|uniref:30S ribosome-binding factor RbfA n=1 Tax=Reichenbachiella sp. 5M10 TaxID=1889772 RepID=UPI000C161396|nr:30S ribosome-binding factor RbfA [Reichenbachiella sp. 5M10]PIB36319.1 ribosome-binding factor A [Reichenbachiella sp. 5M10]
MSGTRQLKYAGLIQKDLSEIFQRDSRHWFGKAFITITEVQVSPDLSFAKVFVSLMMVDDPEGFIEQMAQKKPEIRKALGLKIGKQVRIVPELHFVLDNTQEHAQNIEGILSRLQIPKEKPEEDGSED